MAHKRKHLGPTVRGKPVNAIMSVSDGEEIAGIWVTAVVPDVGCYKLLAKKLADGRCEWVHFTQRADGSKDRIFRGTVESMARLDEVVAAIDRSLAAVYGPSCRLIPAEIEMAPVDGEIVGRPASLPQ